MYCENCGILLLNCRHCGAELPAEQTICHVCGKRVG